MSDYKIIRTREAGVFAGELIRAGDVVLGPDVCILRNARRLWYWSGAASLSELAVLGTSKPNHCQFPIAVPEETVFGVIEIISVTPAARKSIENVPVWTAHGRK